MVKSNHEDSSVPGVSDDHEVGSVTQNHVSSVLVFFHISNTDKGEETEFYRSVTHLSLLGEVTETRVSRFRNRLPIFTGMSKTRLHNPQNRAKVFGRTSKVGMVTLIVRKEGQTKTSSGLD